MRFFYAPHCVEISRTRRMTAQVGTFFPNLFILFCRTGKKNERRRIENGRENPNVRGVGFEPGTFRSLVEHSIHYTTDARPIPGVLIVKVLTTKAAHDVRPDATSSGLINNAKSHHQMSPLYRSCETTAQ